jgi:hypothetical protein
MDYQDLRIQWTTINCGFWAKNKQNPVMIAHFYTSHLICQYKKEKYSFNLQTNMDVIAAEKCHLMRPLSKVETGKNYIFF